jgi:uncharacterized protein YggL (DUF469 family)
MFGLYKETITANGCTTHSFWHIEGKDDNEVDEKMEAFMDSVYIEDNVFAGEGVEKIYDLDDYVVSFNHEGFFNTEEELAKELLKRTKAEIY